MIFDDQEIYQFKDLDYSSLMWLDQLLNRCKLADKEYDMYKVRIDSIDIDNIFAKDEFNEIASELFQKLPDPVDCGNYNQTDIQNKLKQMGL